MRYFLGFIVALFLAGTMNAQISFGINLNLGSQPIWGPTGYDRVDYYYLPDIEVYYSVSLQRFYYNDGGRWVNRADLPYRHRNYDLYNSYKIVLNENQPWKNHNKYKEKYYTYKGRHGQQSIRDSRDSKYFSNKRHPEHNNWVQQQKREKQNDRNDNNRNGDQNNNGNKHDKNRNKK